MVLHLMSDKDEADAVFVAACGALTLREHEQEVRSTKQTSGTLAVCRRALRAEVREDLEIFCRATRRLASLYGRRSKRQKTPREGLILSIDLAGGGWQREMVTTVQSTFYSAEAWADMGLSASPRAVQKAVQFAIHLLAERAEQLVTWDCWYPDHFAAALHPSSGTAAKQRIYEDLKLLWLAERLSRRSEGVHLVLGTVAWRVQPLVRVIFFGPRTRTRGRFQLHAGLGINDPVHFQRRT